MGERNLATRGSAWRRLFATNVTAADAVFVTGGLAAKPFTTPFLAAANLGIISLDQIPTAEKPSFAAGEEHANSIQFRFFGEDGSNDSFSARIWGITEGKGLVGTTAIHSYEATLLAELLITLGSRTGVANTLIEATTSFEADTIAVTYGATGDVVVLSPANDLKSAWARVDHTGYPIIAVEFDDAVNSGTAAAACNALYRFLW